MQGVNQLGGLHDCSVGPSPFWTNWTYWDLTRGVWDFGTGLGLGLDNSNQPKNV